MRKFFILLIILGCLTGTGYAMDFTAPSAPESAQAYMPEDVQSFGEGLWYIIKSAISKLQPSLTEAAGICFSLILIVLIVSILRNLSESSTYTADLIASITIAVILVQPANSLIRLGVETVDEISEYGKLLLPVMTAAMAASGGTTGSAALYTGTVFFDSVLSSAISKLLIPLIYIYIILCISCSAVGEQMLKNLRSFVKWLMTWCLKIILYVFTGYIGITGVISGSADASALKATKLTISGIVPVVGNIISDASEAILVSAGVMKNAVGIYGLLAILAMWIGPFLQIGCQYLLLKATAAVTGVFGGKETVGLIKDFSWIMGFLLAMTGTVCLLLLISIVCFLKGVG